MNRLIALSIASLFACSAADDTGSSNDALVDGADTAQNQASLVVATASGATFVTDSSASAQAAASAVAASVTPPSCLTESTVANVVTYTFADCSGAYGLVHATGVITATYKPSLTEVDVTLASTGFQINSASIDLDVQVVYTESGGTSQMAITSSSSGTGSRKQTVSVTGAYDVTWNPTTSCVALSGKWSTMAAAATWSTTATSFEECAGSCPAAGGSLAFTASAGRSVTISYDGSSTAEVSDGVGKSVPVPLVCP